MPAFSPNSLVIRIITIVVLRRIVIIMIMIAIIIVIITRRTAPKYANMISVDSLHTPEGDQLLKDLTRLFCTEDKRTWTF